MTPAPLLALGFALAMLPALAQDAAPLRYAEGELLVLVAPEYPATILKKGQTGSVVVSGMVLRDGSIHEPAIESVPANDDLEGAVRGVVRYWRLQPRLDEECRFRETRTRITIWFDIDEGKPKVSFSRSVPDAPDAKFVEGLRRGTTSVVSRKAPEYPWFVARNANAPEQIWHVAYAMVGADGAVRSVQVAPRRYHGDFREEIEIAVKQWRFAPGQAFCAEVPVRFSLKD